MKDIGYILLNMIDYLKKIAVNTHVDDTSISILVTQKYICLVYMD